MSTALHTTDPLLDPRVWGEAEAAIGFLETHISRLYFHGERVYKVKRAVNFGFLDFSTLEKRKFACEEEVRLNRRLAPGVYLGVVPLALDASGKLRLRGTGAVVEWAVEMRRLPAERMLDRLLEQGAVDNLLWRELVQRLVQFHAAARADHEVAAYGTPAAIAFNARENFEQTRAFCGTPKVATHSVLSHSLHDFLRERAENFLSAEAELLAARQRSGRIREGHGDLHAGNICFAPAGLVIYDCIEFNERFRCADVAADLAFLAMDLDHAGLAGFAGWVVKCYAKESGDRELPRLLPYYKAYRAIVRAKVAAFRMAAAADAGQAEARRCESAGYFQLAASYDLAPAAFLLCGLPASGKSAVAQSIARGMRATLVRSDVRRKVLAGIAPRERHPEAFGKGLYSPEMGERTYRSLLEQCVDTLAAGRSIVVDATFAKRSQRAPFVDAMARLGLPLYLLWLEAPEELIHARLEQRKQDPHEVSDADWTVYQRAREQFEEPTEIGAGALCRASVLERSPLDLAGVLLDHRLAREARGDSPAALAPSRP